MTSDNSPKRINLVRTAIGAILAVVVALMFIYKLTENGVAGQLLLGLSGFAIVAMGGLGVMDRVR